MTLRYLPIMLDISARSILIIGGGSVAAQKLRVLRQFTDDITVIAEEFCSEIQTAAVRLIAKRYCTGDMAGFDIVYICTNNQQLNREIKQQAASGVLVNVVDDSAQSDFISPAIFKQENMVVAVSSMGTAVKRAIDWRNKIAELFSHGH